MRAFAIRLAHPARADRNRENHGRRLGYAGTFALGHARRHPQALIAAVAIGGLLAVLFSLSRWVELSLFPYAIILQVTPIVAIAPLIIVWANNVDLSLLICARLVAFFPILSTPSSA